MSISLKLLCSATVLIFKASSMKYSHSAVAPSTDVGPTEPTFKISSQEPFKASNIIAFLLTIFFDLETIPANSILPSSIIRKMSEEEMSQYRKPFLKAGTDRQPTLSWPRQIPLEGEPIEVVNIVNDYAEFMKKNNIKKLFINAEPGSILIGPQREFCRSWKNQEEITVKGIHFIQELSLIHI